MRVVAGLALAIAVFAAMPAAAGGPGDPLDGPAACSAVLTQAHDVARPPRNSAEAWVECNFLVTKLTLRASRPLATVRRSAILYGPDPGDGLTCRRPGPVGVRCVGQAGEGVRIRVPMRVVGAACKGGAPPALLVRAVGGLDCDGAPCPDIGLIARASASSQIDCG